MIGFPMCVDLKGNNCTVFGGNKQALSYVETLLHFDAHVTVISPTLCPELQELDEAKKIRHIPRSYYRGDCTNSMMCVAVTDILEINIRIATECKAKKIPICVHDPAEYGNFRFPYFSYADGCVVTVQGSASDRKLEKVQKGIQELLPDLLK